MEGWGAAISACAEDQCNQSLGKELTPEVGGPPEGGGGFSRGGWRTAAECAQGPDLKDG